MHLIKTGAASRRAPVGCPCTARLMSSSRMLRCTVGVRVGSRTAVTATLAARAVHPRLLPTYRVASSPAWGQLCKLRLGCEIPWIVPRKPLCHGLRHIRYRIDLRRSARRDARGTAAVARLPSAHIDRSTISLIDLGCGTGRFSEPLAARFGVPIIATDPSQTMLSCAIAVTSAFATAREADFPHRHFFPAMRPFIESELPARNDIRRIFTAAGFTPVVRKIVRQVAAPSWATFVHKSSRRADSFLARLSDEDFSAGMARLHAHGHSANREDAVTEEIDWFVFTKHV